MKGRNEKKKQPEWHFLAVCWQTFVGLGKV